MTRQITKKQYELALAKVEELLPLVGEDTPADDRNAIELSLMSDIVIAYEKEHFPIGTPTIGELIDSSLEAKGISKKELAEKIGVSPSRISDFVTGRAEPTLKIARALCLALSISPAEMLGIK